MASISRKSSLNNRFLLALVLLIIFEVFLSNANSLPNSQEYQGSNLSQNLYASEKNDFQVKAQDNPEANKTQLRSNEKQISAHLIDEKRPHIFVEEEREPFGTPVFWTYAGLALFCTCFAGLMSGLTVGYLSIDQLDLELKLVSGTPQEKKSAQVIFPILKRHHYLLVTLLLSNATAMEALPIFLDKLVPSFWAVLISVTMVLFFGEIIPQAICIGPQQLMIAEKVAPMVRFLMITLGFICYPISLILDKLLGEHDLTRFKNDQLKTLVQLHSKKALEELQINMSMDMGLTGMQSKIIAGAFDLREQTIDQLVTPVDRVFSLSIDTVLDMEVIGLIKRKGYSRIPVYYGENKTFIIGVLIIKSLIGLNIDPNNLKTLRELSMNEQIMIVTAIYANPQATVGSMLNIFKQGSAHLAIVVEDPQQIARQTDDLMDAMKKGTDMQTAAASTSYHHEIIGITTLEKIIEKILSTPILDEKDVEKRSMRSAGGAAGNHGSEQNHYSMTIMNEESQANMMEMTELLNTTLNANQVPNHMSDEQRNIFGTKFTQLFSEKLSSEVRRDIRDQLHNQQQYNLRVNNDDNHFKESSQYRRMKKDVPEFTEQFIPK